MVTAARVRELLDYDPSTGIFKWRAMRSNNRSVKVGDVAGSLHNRYGYVYIGLDGLNHRAHRLAWMHVNGRPPSGEIDHINGDRADNRISNLRDVPRWVNAQNLRAAKSDNKSSGLLGVQKRHGRWRAHITANGRQHYLGVFDSPEQASAAYLAAKRQLHHQGNTL